MKPAIIKQVPTIKKVPTKEDVEELQGYLSTLPQHELPTNHYMADGMYCREVEHAAGILVVGRVHKKEHFFFLVKGKVNVFTEKGVVELVAPRVLVSSPGTKRVAYALEDSVVITVHKVTSSSFEDIEKEIVEEDKKSMFDFNNKLRPVALCDKEPWGLE